jgi:rubredoxin
MRHQESFSRHFRDITNAFSNVIHCPDCGPPQRMSIKSSYPALYCGRDVLYCQCRECGAEKTEIAMSREVEYGTP